MIRLFNYLIDDDLMYTMNVILKIKYGTIHEKKKGTEGELKISN